MHESCLPDVIQPQSQYKCNVITGHSETGTRQDVAELLFSRHRQWEACVHETTYVDNSALQQTVNQRRSSGLQRRSPANSRSVSAVCSTLTYKDYFIMCMLLIQLHKIADKRIKVNFKENTSGTEMTTSLSIFVLQWRAWFTVIIHVTALRQLVIFLDFPQFYTYFRPVPSQVLSITQQAQHIHQHHFTHSTVICYTPLMLQHNIRTCCV